LALKKLLPVVLCIFFNTFGSVKLLPVVLFGFLFEFHARKLPWTEENIQQEIVMFIENVTG